MFNSASYDNFLKSFFNQDALNTEKFFTFLEESRKQLTFQAEESYKMIEENNKKLQKQFEDNMKLFKTSFITGQVESLMKTSQENLSAAQQYFAQYPTVDKDALSSKVNEFVKVMEENNAKAFKLFQESMKFPPARFAKQ